MDEKLIKAVASEAAREAVKQHIKTEKKNEQKRVLRNTRLLLSHYHELKSHCNHAKYSAEEIVAIDVHGDRIKITKQKEESMVVTSIKRSKVLTMLMIEHIDNSLELLAKQTETQPEKYRVLHSLYIQPIHPEWAERIRMVAEREHISEDTVRRWEGKMVNELSVFLFGVDGLKVF